MKDIKETITLQELKDELIKILGKNIHNSLMDSGILREQTLLLEVLLKDERIRTGETQ